MEKVLRAVGETALRVSRRRLAALPKMRGCSVLMCSLGRCSGREGIIGSCAMVGTQAGDAATDDMVESIMGDGQVAATRVKRRRGGHPQSYTIASSPQPARRAEVEHSLTQALAGPNIERT